VSLAGQDEDGEPSSSAPLDSDKVLVQIVYLLRKLLSSDHTYLDVFKQNPSEISPLYFWPEKRWPQYGETWKTNEREAANDLGHWFAKWALSRVKETRQFVILTHADERTKNKWEREWSHLSVSDPASWLIEETKIQAKRTQDEKRMSEAKKAQEEKRVQEEKRLKNPESTWVKTSYDLTNS